MSLSFMPYSLFIILLILPHTSYSFNKSTTTPRRLPRQLSVDYYAKSCPNVDQLVATVTSQQFKEVPISGPATIRLFFHDCFVEGCDGSVLISTKPGSKQGAEKDAEDNKDLAVEAFDSIKKAKSLLETKCPGVVSCADILAIAARDFVHLIVILPMQVAAIDELVRQVRDQTAKSNTTCILVFGDSSVDPGNNNYIPTTNKGNFPPYGKNFDNGTSTGRFSNGKLATDFIAEALGFRNIVRGFLEPHMEMEDMLHAVSFASAGSGYDDLTANLTNVLTITKQVEYLMHYKIHLSQKIGKMKAAETLRNAIYILSFGTNDFIQNYFEEFDRAKQFTVVQYQNFLISRMALAITKMHRIGARRVAVVGVPPLGCFPLIEIIRDDDNKCDGPLDSVAIAFNSLIKQKLADLSKSLSIRTAYIDIYGSIMSAVQNPKQYGFKETAKGCCGTGTVEYGDSCKGMSTCADPTKYVYWDAVHPTETMYKIVADGALKAIVVGDFLAN